MFYLGWQITLKNIEKDKKRLKKGDFLSNFVEIGQKLRQVLKSLHFVISHFQHLYINWDIAQLYSHIAGKLLYLFYLSFLLLLHIPHWALGC